MQSIGFIGAGNMASAIARGLINTGTAAEALHFFDPDSSKTAVLGAQGCRIADSPEALISEVDSLLLAVKPQLGKAVLTPLASAVQKHQPLIISVLAAIPAASIEVWLGGELAVIRCMPNTPALVGAAASGLFANARTTSMQRDFAATIFSSIGKFVWVSDEHLLHGITATSGSAPAYFFRFAEAMTQAALAQGLDQTQARLLIGQTMIGAATMIMQTDESITQMRHNVCSPNGTTERAIQSFEKNDIDALVSAAMQACFERSEELAEQLGHL